ncbi:hypothetical protein Har1130_04585 [Haloarcula sp. CBA1130]|uniref:sulfatase-like hydrolase/transferase n=1 Tax=unclassified Haloarcula TaxID=2624677 RepID=UPI0012491467|nr:MULTISPECIES: sulfatase-like hydrolase/transferase [unclassified Haloarcula]KAA9398355.1 hypothetical protein Har1129_09075 [Haloarcula sp. CBA1129]KAA9402050.1 hypothetical protein Har1130_04585 [Haloarcula sp. CBA1130]
MDGLTEQNISNVFLYIGDAVRWDSLPESIADRGQTYKTVAASIHTPTSFSSIVTGLHPPQHGVRQFGDSIHADVLSLFSLPGVHSAFANTINEAFNENPDSESILDETLATTESDPDLIADIEPPFVFVERGPGGHAPYGSFPGNGWEYYRERQAAPTSTYCDEYRVGVERDRQYFESRIAELERRGLLDDTLIIYTSDHGELLGEGGCLGHNAPIHPKLAYVPTVFIHPSFESRRVTAGLLRHVDLFPTIAALIGDAVPELPGIDLTSERLADHGACFYRKGYVAGAPLISGESVYESVWDTDGGYVYSRTGRLNRFAIMCGKLLKSAKREYMRRHLKKVVPFHLAGARRYGTPGVTSNQCQSTLETIHDLPKAKTVANTLDSAAEARLRELGYLR